jgi:hypothetical protein
MSGHRVFGVARFPWNLPVDPDALGTTVVATIGGTAVELTLPVLDPRNDLTPLGTKPGHPVSDDTSVFTDKDLGFIAWGYRSRTDQCQVSRALVAFDLPEAPTTLQATSNMPAFQELAYEFGDWFELVGQWSAVWTEIPPGRLRAQRDTTIRVQTLDGRIAGGGAVVSVAHFGRPGMTRAQFESAVDHASRGERTPAEFKFLVDAQVALVEDDFRQAVIDASTATEVALAGAISEQLKQQGIRDEFIDKVVVNAGGLVNLFKLYKDLAPQPPSISTQRLSNEVAAVRNRAVHSGQVPSKVDAHRLVNHATILVNEARPLPQP